MRSVFGAFVALAIGWGLCAPAHAQYLFPIQQTSNGGGGGGGCTGGNSPFVPAGYQCVPGSSDEFNGDLSKWSFTGFAGCAVTSGGEALVTSAAGAGGGCGMRSNFPIPDAPMYMEYRRKAPVSNFAIYQFWTGGAFAQGSNNSAEETDIDMGAFNGCHTDFSVCSGYEVWQNGTNTFGAFQNLGGPNVLDNNYHIIGLQRLPDPAPFGTVHVFVDGVLQGDIPTNGAGDNRYVFPSQHLQPAPWGFPFAGSGVYPHDYLDFDLFCNNPNTSGCFETTVNFDYIRIYTPSGLPNGY